PRRGQRVAPEQRYVHRQPGCHCPGSLALVEVIQTQGSEVTFGLLESAGNDRRQSLARLRRDGRRLVQERLTARVIHARTGAERPTAILRRQLLTVDQWQRIDTDVPGCVWRQFKVESNGAIPLCWDRGRILKSKRHAPLEPRGPDIPLMR